MSCVTAEYIKTSQYRLTSKEIRTSKHGSNANRIKNANQISDNTFSLFLVLNDNILCLIQVTLLEISLPVLILILLHHLKSFE